MTDYIRREVEFRAKVTETSTARAPPVTTSGAS